MSVITHLISAVRTHEAVSVQANLQGKLCRSQNSLYQKGGDRQINTGFEQANLQGKLCRSQNRYAQKGLPA